MPNQPNSNKTKPTRRSMIIVVGMHRSGTSAVTRVLNLCGAKLSGELLKPVKKDNDTGFWESQAIMELHEEIFDSVGCSWHSLSNIPEQWFASADALIFRNRLIELLRSEYAEFDLAIVKDPRICKLVPLWEAALEKMGVQPHYLISVRNPLEITRSLQKRNGFKQSYALSLWLVHLSTLELNTRHASRVFVQYEDLLDDYVGVVSKVSNALGVGLDANSKRVVNSINDFLSVSLRHHHVSFNELDKKNSVPAVVKKLYQWLILQASLCDEPPQDFIDIEAELKLQPNSDFTMYLQNLRSMEKELDAKYFLLNQQFSGLGDTHIQQGAQQQTTELMRRWHALFESQQFMYDKLLTDAALQLESDQHFHEKQLSTAAQQQAKSTTQLAESAKQLTKIEHLLEQQQRQMDDKSVELTEALTLLSDKDKKIAELESTIIDQQRDAESALVVQHDLDKLRSKLPQYESQVQMNAQLSQKLKLAEERFYGLSHTGAWALGARLSGLIRSVRSSLIGRLLLMVKAAFSFNLRRYLAFRRQLRLVQQSGLFDEAYYLRTYPLIAYSLKTPAEHYLGHGEKEGRQPNQVFQPYFYAQQVPGHKNRWGSQLVHYIKEGARNNYDPSPQFSTQSYRQKYALADENPLAYFLSDKQHEVEAVFETSKTDDFLTIGTAVTPSDPLQLTIQNLLNEITQLSLDEKIAKLSFAQREAPKVSIIVPFFNKLEYTVDCLYALQKQTFSDYQVVLIDDASNDDGCQKLADIRGIKYIRNKTNVGYLKSCNKAVGRSNGEYVVQLNNDTLPLAGWLEALLETFQRYPDTGVVGSMLLDEQGVIQEAGGIIFNDASGYNYGRGHAANEYRFNYCRDVDYCSGASIMIKRSVWDELEGYDELFAPAYYEDVDIAMKAKDQGYRVLYNPFSHIVHHEGVSSGKSVESGIKKFQLINKDKFYQKWSHRLRQKPPIPVANEVDLYVRAETIAGRILWVDSTTPTPDKDAGSIETIHFFERAIADGWGISFMPWDAYRHEGAYTVDLQYMGIECLYGLAPTPIDCLQSLVDSYDVIVLSRVTVAKFAYPIVKSIFPDARIIFNTVDLHFLRYEREQELLRRFPNYKMSARSQKVSKEDELFLIDHCDATIVVSDTEADILKELTAQGNVKVIPLFGDVVGSVNTYQERQNIGFIGGFQHPPNVDAVKYFVSDVWPLVTKRLKNARFIIAGSHLTDEIANLASSTVEVRGFIPTVEELLEEVRIMVAPLRYGAGIKGKIVSALCHGVPQVITAEAAEGMGLEHGADVMISSDSQQFADYIIDLYNNEQQWLDVSAMAIHKALALYSKETVSVRISELLTEL